MKPVFIIALIIYLAIFLIISIFDSKGIRSFNDYSVAGKKQSSLSVIMTLLATVIGASTTIGITDTVYNIGFPGIWWLAFGALGLILQSIFLSAKVRSFDADTLPDLANKAVGRSAELIIALIIVISWIGVVAGQLLAINNLIVFATGKSSRLLLIAVSVIVIIYTLIGGQMSVVKTDKLQLIFLIAGILSAFIYLYSSRSLSGSGLYLFSPEVRGEIRLINTDYRPINLINHLFIIGGVYFLGPDIMSRNFISKDSNTAKRSALLSGIFLFIFSLIITFIGIWIRLNVTPDMKGDMGALMYAASLLPSALEFILIFGLLSAVLSSTDTCIINASSIFVKDVLRKDSVLLVRITVAVIGLLALLLALLGRNDIMSLLSGAYSIYTPGVIFPLTIAVFCYKKGGPSRLRVPVWTAAVITGGLFGIASGYFSGALLNAGVPQSLLPYIPLIGMGLSLIIALLSVKPEKRA